MPDTLVTTPLTRTDLSRVFPNNPKVVLAFEQLFKSAASNSLAVTTGTEATQALNDATVVTLSPNAVFNNERVLAIDPASLTIVDNGPGNTVVLAGKIGVNGGFRCQFTIQGDTNPILPADGVIPSSSIGPYATDAAAAAAGVGIGEWYAKTGGTVAWRVT